MFGRHSILVSVREFEVGSGEDSFDSFSSDGVYKRTSSAARFDQTSGDGRNCLEGKPFNPLGLIELPVMAGIVSRLVIALRCTILSKRDGV